MIANKTDFFNVLRSQISEPMYLTDRIDEVKEEIKFNNWIITAPSHIVNQTTTTDYLEFIQEVKENYRNQLDNSHLDIDLTFYLWADDLGALCFNFINSNHVRLPFGCKLKFTDSPEEIVDSYLHSKYHDRVIPWNELQSVETPEEIEEADRLEKELHDNYVLTVYQEKLQKRKQ